ncbi:uncharacterized protein LOC121299537 isoform X1 [Polyodon spathula]|uniref:uncharacterized protein LOC121299537 isoform X1 n=2 Tax=Polyodon spathula TaxID=7913 RepID=UPI001B7ED7A4|nr:uncharacterized protein LOC121299537 isoform X1 [Polyodon spathula]
MVLLLHVIPATSALMYILVMSHVARLSTAKLCGAAVVTQSRKLANFLQDQSEDLLKTYISKQGEGFPQTTSFCTATVEGFPEGNVSDMKPKEMLRSIYITLRHLDGHFQTLRQQQLGLVSPPSDPLHKKLADTHNRIQDLAGNIKCLLEEVPPEISITSSSSGRGIFWQKVFGCTVLRKYSEFLKQVVSGLSHVISKRSATRGKGIKRIQKKVLRLGVSSPL